jgi:hypothetical protein
MEDGLESRLQGLPLPQEKAPTRRDFMGLDGFGAGDHVEEVCGGPANEFFKFGRLEELAGEAPDRLEGFFVFGMPGA